MWSNGEALNYNNINPCDFCEENSEEQDFVIIQPWDGAWSFSNFYNQRKYLLEVPCDNNPISTPEDCSFSTQATTYVWQNLEECVVEQNGDFKWVINGGQNDVYSVYPPVGSARKREFKVTGNGEIEILPSTDYFGVPSGFIFLGFSKDLPLAYVFDNSGRLALCEYNFQERWRVDLPAGTNPDYLQVTELEDVVVVTGTTGVFSREVFFVKVISRNSGEVISETELPEQNLFRFGEAERNEAGDFYIFGTEYMFKLDAQLNLLWTSEFRNVVGYSHFSMGIAPDETAIYAGIKFSQEPVLIKTNSVDGTTAWEKNLDDLLPAGMTTSNNHLLSGVATLDGGVVVGYNTETSDDPSEGYVLEKFSMEGNLVWQRLLGPAYRNYKVQLATSGGGYVLTKKIFAPDFIDHIFLLVTSEGLFEPDCNGGTLADIEVGELLGVTSGDIYEGGDEIELTYNFENTGFANIDQEIDFRFYLTRIVQGDSIKTLLASSIVNGLLVDSLSEGFVTIQIPENVPTELYFIEIVADEENLIPEINELNNRATSSIFEIVNDSSTDCLTDLSGYTALGEFNGSTYFLSENTAKPLDAQAEADDLGGYLVSINSQAENDFLANQISEMVYIGLNDYAVEEEIGWFNNDPLGFTNYDICDFCSANSEDLDFAIMHSWNGGWSWSSLWNSRKYIVELPCPTNLTNGSVNNFASILSENNTVSFSQSAALRLEEVFPNPAREYIVTKISAAEDTEVEVQIFDARGALVKNQKVKLVRGKNQVEINIHDLSSGVYSVFVRTAELGYTTLRFVK